MATRILHELVIDKIAAVDHPCQEHATVAIMKRDNSEELKKQAQDVADLNKIADLLSKQIYMSTVPSTAPGGALGDGAQAEDFDQALTEVIASNLDWKFESAIYDIINPLMDALRKSITSILKDHSLDDSMCLLSIRNSVGQFLTALQAQYQGVVATVASAVTKREEHLNGIRKAKLAVVKMRMDLLQASVTKGLDLEGLTGGKKRLKSHKNIIGA